eukprot:6195839-Pleurochrysis_carterae.AAC.2
MMHQFSVRVAPLLRHGCRLPKRFVRCQTAQFMLSVQPASFRAFLSSKPDQPAGSRLQQMLSMFKEHGIVFVGYYTAMYAASFGVAYAALTASGVDGVALCKKVGVNAIVDTKNCDNSASFEIHQTYAPVAYALAFGSARFLSQQPQRVLRIDSLRPDLLNEMQGHLLHLARVLAALATKRGVAFRNCSQRSAHRASEH